MTCAGAVVLVFLVACAGGPSGDRTTMASIPPPAAATLNAQAGAAAIRHVSRGTEGGREVFEAEWSEGGLEREAKVTATGELLELEIELREADVPAPVRIAAAKALVGATKIKYVRLAGERFEAEAVIHGKEQEVTLTASGACANSDDDDDDEDDDEDDDDDGDHD